MSTTALVCVKGINGKYSCTPVHFDGYIEGGVGETLEKYWVDPEDIFDLCESYDSVRTLGETYQDTEFFDDDDPDYMESLKDIDTDTYLEKQEIYNYVYVYDEATSQWLNFSRRGLIPLSKLIKESIQKKSFEQLCINIINESKKIEEKETQKISKKQLVANGEKDKPNVITEKDPQTEENKENSETIEQQTIPTLTEQEQQFLSKFLQYTYMNLANDKLYNKIIKDFKRALGKEYEQIIVGYVEQEKQKNKQIFEQLKNELSQLREQIKNEEQEKASEANRKLSLISILDNNVVNEAVSVDEKVICYDTGLPDTQVNKDIINSVFGQMSDGIWENSSRMEGYWRYADVMCQDGKIFLVVNDTSSDNRKYNGSKYFTYYNNPYINMSQDQILNFFANKIKQIVYIEFGDTTGIQKWQRNDQTVLDYLSRSNPVKVSDAYKAYDIMKGRIRPDSDYIKLEETSDLAN